MVVKISDSEIITVGVDILPQKTASVTAKYSVWMIHEFK